MKDINVDELSIIEQGFHGLLFFDSLQRKYLKNKLKMSYFKIIIIEDDNTKRIIERFGKIPRIYTCKKDDVSYLIDSRRFIYSPGRKHAEIYFRVGFAEALILEHGKDDIRVSDKELFSALNNEIIIKWRATIILQKIEKILFNSYVVIGIGLISIYILYNVKIELIDLIKLSTKSILDEITGLVGAVVR